MSAELYYPRGPGGNNAGPQDTTVGGSKPLHRFIRGQPKIIGIIVLVLGASFIMLSTVVVGVNDGGGHPIWSAVSYGFLLGTLFIICGILYVVTEHKPTKKTVTASLALTIVTILGIFWTILHVLPGLIHARYYRYNYYPDEEHSGHEDEVWSSHYETMGVVLEATFVFYSLVGVILFIVMSSLAGAALRSSKSQAIIVMTAVPSETPAE